MNAAPGTRRRLSVVALVVVVAAGGVAAGTAVAAHRNGESAPARPTLSTTTVVRTDLATTASFTGTTGFGAVETVTGSGTGTITGLPSAGSAVRRGQPLYSVDDRPVPVFYGSSALFRTLRLPPGAASGALAPPASVVAARHALQSAREQVAGDAASLSEARALRSTEGRAALLQADAQLASDRAALVAARNQLAADEQLGCPAASSSTVGSSPPAAGTAGGASSPAGSSGASTAGIRRATVRSRSASGGGEVGAGGAGGTTTTTTSIPPAAPSVDGEQAAGETTTAVTLSGSVAPNGLATTYYFEYGTSTAYGSSTTPVDVGSGSAPVPASATLSGLAPGTTYLYTLVAVNADGTTTGVATTFTTATSSCVEQRQTVRADVHAVTADLLALAAARITTGSTVASDSRALAADQATEQADQQALRRAERDAPKPSRTELRGADVALVARNLEELGYGPGAPGSSGATATFTPALARSLRRWQAAVGLDPTGTLAPGQVVVLPGPARVAAVTARVGEQVGGSALLSVSGTTKVVTFTGTGTLEKGERVSVTAGGGTSLAGTIAAATPDAGKLHVRVAVPDGAALPATGTVTVDVTTESRPGVLAVPEEALLALANGGYALQKPGGRLLPVTTGLVAGDLVEVAGAGVHAGLVVVTAA